MNTKTLLFIGAGVVVGWYFLGRSSASTQKAPVPDAPGAIRHGVRADGSQSTWTEPAPIDDVNDGIPPLVEPPFPEPLEAGVNWNFAGHDITTVTRT